MKMAAMSPEEFLEKHGLKPEFIKPYCQEWLCQQYQNDVDTWNREGNPKPSVAYNRVVADVAAMQHLGCKCLLQ